MPTLPTLSCPICRRAAEYQYTIEMLDPPVGKIDIAYCAGCARLLEHIRSAGTTYESTSWLPVCRTCRQPVSFAGVGGTDPAPLVTYRCREHADECWEWESASDTWRRN